MNNNERVSQLRSTDKPLKRPDISKMSELDPLSKADMERRKLIYPGMGNRTVLNAFRELRTKLMQKSRSQNYVLMVTPTCWEGGGSFISTNLANAIALDRGKSAVLIDCNLYQPQLHELLGVNVDHGLADFLESSDVQMEDIVYATGISRLRLVPVGREFEPGTEVFTSERMRAFIDELKSRYPDRYIIIDAPPIADSADARILQDLCDYTLLVLPYGKVSESQVESAVAEISQEKFAGIVLNDF